mgnify:CR=1 FL=1
MRAKEVKNPESAPIVSFKPKTAEEGRASCEDGRSERVSRGELPCVVVSASGVKGKSDERTDSSDEESETAVPERDGDDDAQGRQPLGAEGDDTDQEQGGGEGRELRVKSVSSCAKGKRSDARRGGRGWRICGGRRGGRAGLTRGGRTLPLVLSLRGWEVSYKSWRVGRTRTNDRGSLRGGRPSRRRVQCRRASVLDSCCCRGCRWWSWLTRERSWSSRRYSAQNWMPSSWPSSVLALLPKAASEKTEERRDRTAPRRESSVFCVAEQRQRQKP